MIKNDYSDWYAELLTQTTIIESFDCERVAKFANQTSN